MAKQNKKESAIELGGAIDELIALMRDNPEVREENELALGQKALSIRMDQPGLAKLFDLSDFHKTRLKVLRDAVEDLSSGAPLLMKSRMGVRLSKKGVSSFCEPLVGEAKPSLFSIELKDAAAFKDYGQESEYQFHDQTANAAIYYLVHLMASEESAN